LFGGVVGAIMSEDRLEDVREKQRNRKRLCRERKKKSALSLSEEVDPLVMDELLKKAEEVELARDDELHLCLVEVVPVAPLFLQNHKDFVLYYGGDLVLFLSHDTYKFYYII
jgi:hypothetical protein